MRDVEVEGWLDSRGSLINWNLADLVDFIPKIFFEHHVCSVACAWAGLVALFVDSSFALECLTSCVVPVFGYGHVVLDQAMLREMSSKHSTCIATYRVFGALGSGVVSCIAVETFQCVVAREGGECGRSGGRAGVGLDVCGEGY